jgi:hypothetical protein
MTAPGRLPPAGCPPARRCDAAIRPRRSCVSWARAGTPRHDRSAGSRRRRATAAGEDRQPDTACPACRPVTRRPGHLSAVARPFVQAGIDLDVRPGAEPWGSANEADCCQRARRGPRRPVRQGSGGRHPHGVGARRVRGGRDGRIRLLNVSYDPTRELYQEIQRGVRAALARGDGPGRHDRAIPWRLRQSGAGCHRRAGSGRCHPLWPLTSRRSRLRVSSRTTGRTAFRSTARRTRRRSCTRCGPGIRRTSGGGRIWRGRTCRS